MGQLKFFVLLTTILSGCSVVQSDLPIHAVMSDVLGTWKFTLSATTSSTPMGCGGGVPNMNIENLEPEIDNFYSWLEKDTGVGISTRFVLTKTTAFRGDGPGRKKWKHLLVMLPGSTNDVGTWTMVYDEGFELRVGSTRFFAVMKYTKAEGRSCTKSLNGDAENTFGRTKCYSTDPSRVHMGWTYRERRGTVDTERKWGCFYAEKEYQPDAGALVISGHNYRSPNLPRLTDFLDSNSCKVKALLAKGKQHVFRTTSWKASNTQFRDVPPEHLASYKGHLGYEKIHRQMGFSLPMFRQSLVTDSDTAEPLFSCPIISATLQAEAGTGDTIPSTWTWGDPFLSKEYDATSDFVLNQISASFVLQKRFEILFKRLFPESQSNIFDLPLSPQTLLSCSPFNQGCDGGFPFLVGKHAREIGIGTEACQLYLATDDSEAAPCLMNIGSFRRSPKESATRCGPDERWYARDYHYVGGFYEGCDERRIMEEIYYNGPVVAAIDAPDALFLYEDGFFDTKPDEHGRLCDSPHQGFTGWEYTNHAVAIVGWGEDSPTMPGMPRRKFWVVRNTWGNDWGRNGYIKIKRGENLAAIESQAVAIDPDITRGKAAHVLKLFQDNQVLHPAKVEPKLAF